MSSRGRDNRVPSDFSDWDIELEPDAYNASVIRQGRSGELNPLTVDYSLRGNVMGEYMLPSISSRFGTTASSSGAPLYRLPNGTTSNLPPSQQDEGFGDEDFLSALDAAPLPSWQPSADSNSFLNSLRAGLGVAQIPAPQSGECPFGNAVTGFANETQVGDVPVYIVSVDIHVTDPQSFETVSDWAFNHAYAWLLQQRGMREDANDYAQVRLLRGSGGLRSAWDIVSEMLPATDVLHDFLAAYYLMLQSPKYASDDRSTLLANLGLGEDDFHFRITFVLHTADNASVTSNNIASVLRYGADNAASGTNSRVRFNAEREKLRFVARSQDSYLPRSSALNSSSSGLNSGNLTHFRQFKAAAEKNIRKGKLPVPFVMSQPALDYTEPSVPAEKRAYKKRRTADEIKEAMMGLPIGQVGEKRARKEWSEGQRAKYNEARKQKRYGNGEVHGLQYDKMKSRLFHHTSIEEFYLYSKAVLQVPNTWSQGYCLAMAFLKSQCRTFSSDGVSIVETKPFASKLEDGEYPKIPILEPYQHLSGQDCDFIQGEELVLFNPFKYASEDTESDVKYCLSPCESIVQRWYSAAKNLHLFVEQEVGMELDENSEATLQAYADVFDVYVSLYNLEVMGKRTSLIKPAHASTDVRSGTHFRMVSLLISDKHCSAITCLRTFLRNSVSANRSSIHNYCVFCEKLFTANNQTKAEADAHFTSCAAKKNGRICCESDKINRKKVVSDIHPDQYWFNTRKKCWICKLCSQEMVGGTTTGQIHHLCWINKPSELKIGEESGIYVYDFECAQVKQPDQRTFVHVVNLVCVRRVYASEDGGYDEHSFATLDQFIAYVLSHQKQKRVYLAHNGAKYDVQFIVNYFEKNLIAHHFVPSPGSMHAYLSVTVEFGAKAKATFLDFRHFMPGSLKNIAISFGLSQQKGDFPHHFNNGMNDNYIGCIPEMGNPADFWCIESKRSQEEVDEFTEWHTSQCEVFCDCVGMCTCTKQKWCFQTELIKYCRLDVNVLAEACARYRNWTMDFSETIEGWTACPIDPFEYLTIPQVAMGVLLAGLPEEENIAITPWKDRRDRVTDAIAWMERISKTTGWDIHHAGNWGREYMCAKTRRYLDGVTDDMHVFICLNCEFHACPHCFHEEMETGVDHPTRPATYGKIAEDTREFLDDVFRTYGSEKTHVIWAHECVGFTDYEKQLGEIIKDREMFKGGRTEVFSPHFNVAHYPDEEIKYHDVCSLYPYVCAFAELPIGNPDHFIGEKIDMNRFWSTGEDRYMGFMRCQIKPNVQDKLGLLPCHDKISGRLEFPLHVMTGTWGTEELRLACENGYELLQVYEVLHFPPSERSDTVMRGYVSFFLRMKQVRLPPYNLLFLLRKMLTLLYRRPRGGRNWARRATLLPWKSRS